ncbi:MAG: two pore domain potassium channel family protein [Saprospiraceae bacterium]|nr:two pore domain potassium channel family protein [Saprospiraceae bacterium]
MKNIGLKYYYQIDSLDQLNSLKLEKVASLTENIRLNVVEYYLGQINNVGAFDFIYFSIVTATSTGYGDILPNSTLVRILVSFEIFLCLFLFGFFFYYIAKPNKKTE